jgi:FKBP-type peptidyl-prolyl cis-trans isomerase
MLRRSRASFTLLLLLAGVLLADGLADGVAFAAPAPRSGTARQELAAGNLRAGKAFLAANGKRPGVFTTPTGLQFEILKPGAGALPNATDLVTIRFQWSLPDDTKLPVMDSGSPVTVPADNLVEGFTEAVRLMAVGAKWRIWLPPALAFGESGRGSLVGPNQVVVIDCEMFGIRPLGAKPPSQ